MSTSSDGPDEILQEQIAYYRARASEYDVTVVGPALDPSISTVEQFQGDLGTARDLLLTYGPFEHTLELACGTGIWTEVLKSISGHVTAVDAAPEMLEIVHRKLGDDSITYGQADLFHWQPRSRYDCVFFAFWLSHVPPRALDNFLANVTKALAPNGRLIIIDQYAPLPSDSQVAKGDIYAERPLLDGRTFTIVKVFYPLDLLRNKLAALNLVAKTQKLGSSFYFLVATRS